MDGDRATTMCVRRVESVERLKRELNIRLQRLLRENPGCMWLKAAVDMNMIDERHLDAYPYSLSSGAALHNRH